MRTNPASLKLDGELPLAYLRELYHRYYDDLVRVTDVQFNVLGRIKSSGFNADFGDFEGELLYLLLRDACPDVVVEISPNHGYSTGYILSALHDNHKGKLFSYEIIPNVNGIPIGEVIRSNLPEQIDMTRFELTVGDARNAEIPEADFVFLDSSHETGFAAWYCQEIISSANLCFVHDIVAADLTYGTILKAPTRGIMESHHLLQTLADNNQGIFHCARIGNQLDDVRSQLKPRFNVGREGVPDRSIVFTGHQQTSSAIHSHKMQLEILNAIRSSMDGDRNGACKTIKEIVNDPTSHPFIRVSAIRAAAIIGYRMPFHANLYQGIDLEVANSSISILAASFDAALMCGDYKGLNTLLNLKSHGKLSSGAAGHLKGCYRAMAGNTATDEDSFFTKVAQKLFS